MFRLYPVDQLNDLDPLLPMGNGFAHTHIYTHTQCEDVLQALVNTLSPYLPLFLTLYLHLSLVSLIMCLQAHTHRLVCRCNSFTGWG